MNSSLRKGIVTSFLKIPSLNAMDLLSLFPVYLNLERLHKRMLQSNSRYSQIRLIALILFSLDSSLVIESWKVLYSPIPGVDKT